MKRLLALGSACIMLYANNITPQADGIEPRTLHDYVNQETDFIEFLKDRHPMFKYEKEGRLVGKYSISNRQEEFVEFGGHGNYEKDTGRSASITYRLGMESILDYPNKFVGPKKCGECHPAQYEAWNRSRHSKVIRFPDELEEAGGDPKKPMYGSSEATILPKGVEADDVFVIVGTPRTKYGFIDKWLVRGTYHIEDGKLADGTGKMVAGGNQFSRLWVESLTPEVAKKIAEFSPGFPTKLEDFGKQTSSVWGINSYGSTYKEKMMFQPASAYCEVCHSFKFDFKSKEEFLAAIGNKDELRKHAISKGISCEECHGAGAHLYGARGAGMPSNCERCHQRFAYDSEDAKIDPRKPFNSYFKSACPSCGTEGSQMYNTMHYDKGMRCSTCHDPHEVTANDWKDPYTKVGLKKTCSDCHETQAEMFKYGGAHAKDNCTGCHMPNMMSCENFASVQNPDKGGFDNVRASHIWKIYVDKDAKTLNPPEGKPRDPQTTKGWTIARKDGKFFVDLMWSCGRTSWSDVNLVGPGASGCHSAVQSTLPKELHFTDQEQIYDKVMEWQLPVKEGFKKLELAIRKIDREQAKMDNLSTKTKSEIILLTKEARAIYEKIEKDGSWGVHGPKYALKLINEALVYVAQAQDLLDGKK
ncbi:multiheme c-type cytochrome [Campylobacter sp. RM12647]|uniref:multiheme c-type cytochrome n=1 Tax=unclassified Campylobacter TaxID=2593542 RepID=UPI001D7E81C5|nr:cytochrome C [Campylobacter sp. RM12647]MBZ7990946.1 cytochrome C [Campylobacter sp. RM9331]MBZ8005760.1 cytochrome C [Campylobacter sp. RM9332]